MSNPRVLKAHREAVKMVFREQSHLLTDGDLDGFIEAVAVAVITAEDHTATRGAILLRAVDGDYYAFGPYATPAAARKVAPDLPLEGHAMVLPLTPAPKGPARTKR